MSEERAGTRLGEGLEVPVGEERLARGWQAVAARAYGAPAPAWGRLRIAGAVSIAVAAAVALAVGIARPGESAPARGPLAIAAGSGSGSVEAAIRAAGGAADAAVALDDGSVIRVARGAALEALENSGDRFSLVLRAGSARFDVRPGGGRRWTIEAGLVSVEVIGTAFEVARDERGVRVAVERGRVLVRGESVPDRVRSLGAGESIRVDAAPVVRAPEPGEVAPVSAGAAEPSESEGEGEIVPEREQTPRHDARSARGESAAPERGSDRSAGALLAEADAARREGRVEEALSRLAEASRREGDPDAALASLTRGRLALEHGRAAEAVQDLRRAIATGLPARLEELARARLVEALVRSGDHAGAQHAADEYLRAHPDGTWRDAVTRALAER